MESNRARLLPNDSALFPPVCIWRIMKNHNAASRDEWRPRAQQLQRPAAAGHVADDDVDALLAQRLDHVGIVGRHSEVESLPSAYLPRTSWPLTVTSRTFPWSTSDMNVEKIDLFVLLLVAAVAHHLPQQDRRTPQSPTRRPRFSLLNSPGTPDCLQTQKCRATYLKLDASKGKTSHQSPTG